MDPVTALRDRTGRVRLHIGSGRCYLTDWINCELPLPHVHLASDRPDLVAKWATDYRPDDYYARQVATLEELARGKAEPDEWVCDLRGDWLHGHLLPHGAADEILCRQVLEHLSPTEAELAFERFDWLLKAGGELVIDVPDHEGTVEAVRNAEGEERRGFLLRHLLGHREDRYGYHLMGYTRRGLRDLAKRHGFAFVGEEGAGGDRLYPAFAMRFHKPAVGTIDPYAWTRIAPYEIPDKWKCLEVGPGGTSRAWPRADAWLELAHIANTEMPGDDWGRKVEVKHGDICDRTPWGEKAFDFALLAHVLEHVKEPLKAVAEINRIVKAGVIECPHPFKEFLFGFEETDHRWWVTSDGETLTFTKPDDGRVKDWRLICEETGWGGAIHRNLRLGPVLGYDGRAMREAYLRGQASCLNTIHRWEGELKAVVVE